MSVEQKKIPKLEQFAYQGEKSVNEDIRQKYGFESDLLAVFSENDGPIVHKWHHYLPIYDRYFAPWRGRPLRFLEIGVSRGGSLQMWRRFFGPDAVIFGIDVDPDCAALDGQAGQVRIGSQADEGFLRRVVDEMGGVDVVLDDGSHRMDHIQASLQCLFPMVTPGGLYMIEDLHTAYWPRYRGGLRAETNFFAEVGKMVDDMHHWYHGEGPGHPERASWISGIHVHDSIVVLDKNKVYPPVHSMIGGNQNTAAE